MLTTDASFTTLRTLTVQGESGWGYEGGLRDRDVEKLQEVRRHEKEEVQMEASLHCWWPTACHPGSIMIFD